MAQQTLFCLDLFPFSFVFYLTVDGPRYADIYYLLWTRLLTISGSFQAFNNHRRYKNQQAFAVWSEHKIKSTGEAHFANDSSVPSNKPLQWVSMHNTTSSTFYTAQGVALCRKAVGIWGLRQKDIFKMVLSVWNFYALYEVQGLGWWYWHCFMKYHKKIRHNDQYFCNTCPSNVLLSDLQCELIISLLSSSREKWKKTLIILHHNQQQPVTTAGADGEQTISWCKLLFRTNYAVMMMIQWWGQNWSFVKCCHYSVATKIADLVIQYPVTATAAWCHFFMVKSSVATVTLKK